jgi:hypothetical protein
MEFRLPENLQVELLSYDPALKALARQNKPASTKTKSKYPLGNPNWLIPNDVIRQSMLDDAITNINSCPANTRFQVFKKLVAEEQMRALGLRGACTSIVHAILYHYEQCWYAAWLPPVGKEDQYVYGYSVAYKDTAAANKAIPYRVKNKKDEYTQVTYGRSLFYTYTKLVTKQDICNGHDDYNWNIASVPSYYEKSRELAPVIKQFADSVKSTVPVWDDSKNIFDRIKGSQLVNILFCTEITKVNSNYWTTTDRETWIPSYENIIKLITFHAHTAGWDGHIYNKANKILHIISKPFFKKWIQFKCDECIAIHQDTTNNRLIEVRKPWTTIFELFERIQYVNTIWPDCPIDYYQTHIDMLLGIRTLGRYKTEKNVGAWLQEHMPVASFFTIMSKFYEEESKGVRSTYNYSNELGINQYSFHSWSDTVNMIGNILNKDVDLAPPKRWRIDEFHDYVQAESWKLTNKNESLPQDLFPIPIKVALGSSSWSFFQPIDTHQLAQWGQAVRNCVGNATHYAEGVRKKKHFIVLAMVDNKPQFTIQLEVNMGLMSVKQIAGVGNARLNEETEELYKTSFAKALQLREEQLKS